MASLFYFVFLFIWSFLFSSSHFSCAVVVVFYLFFYPGTLNTHTLTGWRTCGFCLRRRYLVRRGVNIATLPPSSDGGILMVLPPLFFLFTQKTRLRFCSFQVRPDFSTRGCCRCFVVLPLSRPLFASLRGDDEPSKWKTTQQHSEQGWRDRNEMKGVWRAQKKRTIDIDHALFFSSYLYLYVSFIWYWVGDTRVCVFVPSGRVANIFGSFLSFFLLLLFLQFGVTLGEPHFICHSIPFAVALSSFGRWLHDGEAQSLRKLNRDAWSGQEPADQLLPSFWHDFVSRLTNFCPVAVCYSRAADLRHPFSPSSVDNRKKNKLAMNFHKGLVA